MGSLTRSVVLLVGVLLTNGQCQKAQVPVEDKLVGRYASVTESDCNVLLKLQSGHKAEIVQTCSLEDFSHRVVSNTTLATWSLNGNRLTLEYEKTKDVLEYVASLSYKDFGDAGSGPGLCPARRQVNAPSLSDSVVHPAFQLLTHLSTGG